MIINMDPGFKFKDEALAVNNYSFKFDARNVSSCYKLYELNNFASSGYGILHTRLVKNPVTILSMVL